MKFTLHTDLPFWIANTDFCGHPVQVKLETEDETASDAAHTGQRILDHVQANWDLIQQTLVNDLLPTHNEIWADPSRNRPSLSPSKFLENLTAIAIEFGVWDEDDGSHELCSVYFEDSNMFGGHSVHVWWNPSTSPISPSARIEG